MSRLTAALRLRPGEQRLAGWLIALFAVTQSGHGLGSNTADALLFVRYGVERLPAMIALSGAVAMLATLAYGVGLARMGLRRLLPATALGLATALVVERAAITTGAAAVYPTIWLTEQAVILVTLTMMWNAAAEACDARQAKRLFPVLASAGIAGGVAGNFATGPAAYLLGTENLLLVHAALLVAAAALNAGVAARFLPAIRRPSGSVRADLRAGWTMTARSRFLRLAALAAAGFSALFFLVVFPFAEQVTASFSSDADVAAFLGFFSGAATVAAFLVSLLLANRVFAMVGVVGAVLIATMVYAAGFALWIASFTLATAAAFRAAQWVAVNAIGLTAWNSLFNVADAGRRGAVMAFHTAVPMQIGVIASGALLLAWPGGTRELALLGAGLAAGVAAVVWRMRSEYPTALVDAVRRGLDVFAAAPGLGRWAGDADTVRALAAALDDPRPGIRRIAVGVLGRLRAGSEQARLVSALRDPEPIVRCAAVDALGRIGAGAVPQMAPLLDDPDPQVRAAAAGQLRDDAARMTLADMATAEDPDTVSSALGALAAWPDAAAGLDLAPLLSSPRPAIRLRAGEVMLRIGHPTGTAAALELLDDPDESVRAGAASLLAARHDTEAALLETLRYGSLDGQEAAARALAGRAAAAAPLAAWAARETERALRLRRRRAALHDLDRSASVAYLRHVLEQRRRMCERRALVAVESLAGGATAHVLSRGVRAADPQVRAQAIEALDALADRSLRTRLIPLLEDEPEAIGPADAALAALAVDEDPWLRALATRCIDDGTGRSRSGDPASDHRAGGAPITERTENLMTDQIAGPEVLDRMMRLQQVPMFSQLEPEDLSRIAALCMPRAYQAEEVIYGLGDAGDEMLIIGDGRVRISVPAEGRPRVLRRFGPGEHVGELAVLRGMPRNADVIADEPVTGLIIRSTDLRSLLAGRPEVAMAMLGTLAERLGTIV